MAFIISKTARSTSETEHLKKETFFMQMRTPASNRENIFICGHIISMNLSSLALCHFLRPHGHANPALRAIDDNDIDTNENILL